MVNVREIFSATTHLVAPGKVRFAFFYLAILVNVRVISVIDRGSIPIID